MSESDTTQKTQSIRDGQHFDISSLYIVKSEIDASLTQVEAALNLYMTDQSNTVGIFDSTEGMQQTTGVLKLLKMDGAVELSDTIRLMLVHISENPDSTDDSQITALSESLMTLSRYLEFVLLRETLSPQLLLPITNIMRRLLNKPTIAEGEFLLHDINDGLLQNNITTLVKPAISTEKLTDKDRKNILRLFQAGLHGILQKKPQANAYAYMQKAVAQIADREPQNAEGLYWQLAKQVVSTLNPSTMMTNGRKRVLVQMERRIARKSSAISRLSQTNAISDLLTMTAIEPQHYQTIISTLGLENKIKPDQEVLEDKQFLFGPDQSVVHDVSELAHQSILKIKELIDLIVNQEQQPDGLTSLSEQLKELGYTLLLLTLNKAGQGLLEQSNLVEKWPQQPDENQINSLMDCLLASENAIILMEQTHTPGLVMSPFTNLKVSLHQLVEARSLIVAESRLDLTNVMHSLLAYLDSEKDLQKIEGIAAVCETVGGAMAFLNAPRGQAILQSAAKYINEKFSPDHHPDASSIANLTDAIICVDYILEGLATKKPAGDQPYGYGESSLARLGYPVKTAA
ncbi:MAG: hypothetical protein KGO49_11585 [Gammaproteobacteria bacterium]|nr:hypothetical protein [Gammaproteobacteria bacterium]